MSKQERQIRRVALIGTLVVMLVGGVLSAAPMLLSLIQPAVAQPDDTARLPLDSTALRSLLSRRCLVKGQALILVALALTLLVTLIVGVNDVPWTPYHRTGDLC